MRCMRAALRRSRWQVLLRLMEADGAPKPALLLLVGACAPPPPPLLLLAVAALAQETLVELVSDQGFQSQLLASEEHKRACAPARRSARGRAASLARAGLLFAAIDSNVTHLPEFLRSAHASARPHASRVLGLLYLLYAALDDDYGYFLGCWVEHCREPAAKQAMVEHLQGEPSARVRAARGRPPRRGVVARGSAAA